MEKRLKKLEVEMAMAKRQHKNVIRSLDTIIRTINRK